MRRQGGHYGAESGGGGGGANQAYGGGAGSMRQQQQQQRDKSGYYQELPIGEKEGHQHHNQWRWERDDALAKLPQTPMSPTAPFAEGQGHEGTRSYYQSQRMDPRMPLEKQSSNVVDPRAQAHEEDMDIGYEDNQVVQTFEALEQRFLDDIMKLSKEQTDAEDAENARHRARLNVINAQYEEQLAALRARHASRRDEFLRRDSQARQQQYQQIAMEQQQQFANSVVAPNDPPRGYNAGSVPTEEPHRAYNSDHYDTYNRERGRYSGNARDHEFEQKVPYPRGRNYGSGGGGGGGSGGSRYY
ncbi:uncharacterized protein LOC127260083 [Andrographis paniculata]|uniref:uncharacterized protein LOC127260083 n=1 Tax=Andrographis paniculata TaxID=175694 RepID=UPI0021E9A7EA|nr:uncharacterized protein LOC127260083 [Andrographis paniculata]